MKRYTILPFLAILLFAGTPQLLASVLLLHGGHVIQGDASKVEEIYHLKTGTGEIRIAAHRVERVFDTIEDVYRWKRTLIRVGNHSDHIALVRWCLKYDLFDLAQGELVAAELAESGTPMVDYLQRRLTTKRKVSTSEMPRRFTPLPSAKPLPTVSRRSSPGKMVSLEALDQTAASISPRSMAQFSSTIQPILLNNCATGGCHVGAGSEKMRLYRSGLAGKARRRTTQRNLHAVMEWLNPDRPDYSPLLTIPLRPHEKNPRAMVEGHREEYRRLVYWAFQVSRERNVRMAARRPGFDAAVKRAMHTEPVDPSSSSKLNKPNYSAQPKKSIVQETLDLIPPEGAKLQKKGKDGRLEPIYPSNNVTSTSPFRKALAVNPSLLKSFIKEKGERR